MQQTKLFRKIGTQIVGVIMLLALSMTISSCEEDSPNYQHTASDLEGPWKWKTNMGDIAEYFEVTIIQNSDNEFVINNFNNVGDAMKVKVSGTSLSFGGDLLEGEVVVSNGTGTITNGWQTMTLKYDVTDGDGNYQVEAELNFGNVISKTAIVASETE